MKRSLLLLSLLVLLRLQSADYFDQLKTGASIGAKSGCIAMSSLVGVVLTCVALSSLQEVHDEYKHDQSLVKARIMQEKYPRILVDRERCTTSFMMQKGFEVAIACACLYPIFCLIRKCYRSIKRDLDFLKKTGE